MIDDMMIGQGMMIEGVETGMEIGMMIGIDTVKG
jgi:hypothetical protein